MISNFLPELLNNFPEYYFLVKTNSNKGCKFSPLLIKIQKDQFICVKQPNSKHKLICVLQIWALFNICSIDKIKILTQ